MNRRQFLRLGGGFAVLGVAGIEATLPAANVLTYHPVPDIA